MENQDVCYKNRFVCFFAVVNIFKRNIISGKNIWQDYSVYKEKRRKFYPCTWLIALLAVQSVKPFGSIDKLICGLQRYVENRNNETYDNFWRASSQMSSNSFCEIIELVYYSLEIQDTQFRKGITDKNRGNKNRNLPEL